MKAQFDRAKLPASSQASYDMWALELDRAETSYKFRRYQPPFYSFLYSVHSQLPDFLINTHTVSDAADMAAYNARLRAIGPTLDVAIDQSRKATAEGVHAPRFEIERVIAGSKVMTTASRSRRPAPTRRSGRTPRPRSASCRPRARRRPPKPRRCWPTRAPASWG